MISAAEVSAQLQYGTMSIAKVDEGIAQVAVRAAGVGKIQEVIHAGKALPQTAQTPFKVFACKRLRAGHTKCFPACLELHVSGGGNLLPKFMPISFFRRVSRF